MEAEKLKVSVIIPAYSFGRMDDLKEAVNSVLAQSRKPDEVIVAVDHNEKLLDELQKVGGIRAGRNVGVVGGAETRNAGIRSAMGDVVVFIDDDAIAEKNWLENLVDLYDDPAVVAVGGKTMSDWDDGRPSWFPEELDWLVGGIWKGHPVERCEVRNLIGPNMSFRKNVCDKVGYFRAELGAMPDKARAGDETEFYIRLKNVMPEGKIIYEPKAVVYHKVYEYKTTLKYLIIRSFRDGYFKSKTIGIYQQSSKKPFTTESSYLKYLLLGAIPSKVLRFYQTGMLAQAGAIILSIVAFGTGYLRGIFGRKKVAS